MENVLTGVSLLVFLPLLGMLTNLFLGKYLGEYGVGVVAVSASGGAFVVALLMLAGLVANDYHAVIVNAPLLDHWIYIPSANIDIPWQFRVDALSVTMMLVVSGVGTLIHIYAIGYMHGDSRFPRFFVYLNLFLAFMMILITGNNLLMMFVGWEGVGLCSFLLIGFWFDRANRLPNGMSEGWKNSNAARKAFIVNRVGDFGVLMAIFLCWYTFGTLDFYKAGEAPLGGHAAEGHEAEATHSEEATVDEGEETHVESSTEASEEASHEGTEEASHAVEAAHDVHAMGIYNQAETYILEDHEVDFGSIHMDFDVVLTLITLFMLLGVTGKSAQIPLFVWLPDAMAGPTPVSALIHAATMVTAGVYMMVRSNSFFHHAELTSFIVTLVGCATAIMAGFVALGQWDVKRVLAYSTVSQLGFMVAAVGIGAYAAAMFHLVTHAVFKALLFLGSGSIIHGMEHGHHHLHDHHGHDDHGHDDHAHDEHAHDEHDHAHGHEEAFDPQDMRNMGGLRHKMPITYWTYLIGTLALAGIFPFAGFWSKDEILADSFNLGWREGELKGFIALMILILAAAFTAFYMWRQVSLVFYGKPRHAAAEHASESNSLMTLPLVILAIGSVLIGFINVPTGVPILSSLIDTHVFTEFLEHAVVHVHAGGFLWALALIAVGLALGAIFAARSIYNDATLAHLTHDPLEESEPSRGAFELANAKLYWDEIYFRFIENPYNVASKWLANRLDWELWHNFFHERVIFGSYHAAAKGLSNNIDRGAIDRGILMVGAQGVALFSRRLRRVQTGYVRTYALTVVFGTVVILLVILFPVIRDLLGV
jgi:NADH-quinone oxidoreductase subunit L